MNEINLGVSGKFILHAENAETGQKRKLAEFSNLVLDQGIEHFLANGYTFVIYYVQVGSGNAPPTPGDISLQNHVAGTNRNFNITYSNSGAPNYFAVHSFSWQFNVGAAAGNLSEIGVGWQDNGYLFSRELIRDANGNPTTITVLPNEYLNVNYILKVKPLLMDVTGTINLAGIDYEYTIRSANVGSFQPEVETGLRKHVIARAYTGNIGSITGRPSGTALDALSLGSEVYWKPYQSGSMVSRLEILANPSRWNHPSGIKSILIDVNNPNGHEYQIEFSPAIPKTDTQTLKLEFGVSITRE